MKQFSIFILIAAMALFAGCGSKPANNAPTEANAAPQEQVSEFASITDAAQALAEGNRLMDENDTERAIAAYRRAIELDADQPEAHFKLGIAYGLVEMQMEQEGRAADTLDSKGKRRSEKEFEKAVDAYKKYLDKNPDDDAAHYNLARTYNKLNKDEEAEKEFRAAVKLKPEDTEYQTDLGDILIKLAKYHEAIPPLKKALEIDAGNERAQSLLEDAQAGRQRIDYISNKMANSNTSQKSSSSSTPNTNANSASNSNTAVRPSNTNTSRPPQQGKPSPTPGRPSKPAATTRQ